MSWVKKRGSTTPSPNVVPPPVQMYNPNQPPNTQENQWMQQQQQHNNWYGQNWQHHQQSHPQQQQQYGEYQEPTSYYQNNFNYQQQQQQPQTYGNMQYSQYNQNNVYGSQEQTTAEGDRWSSNWAWGDEDNSNIQPNTNNITDSFANDETWNWSVEDQKPKNENDPTMIKNHPSIDRITGKRGKLDTPQWSVESQVSQESSDDILQTSESDKSRMLSRSSTVSHSPISGQDLPPSNDIKEVEIVGENSEIVTKSSTPPTNTKALPPLPPQGSDDSKGNPYKRTTSLSHKAANNMRGTNNITPSSFHSQSVNLEAPPDNSEQPDPVVAPQTNTFLPRKASNPSPQQQWAENNEAPINDRNQYLETGQLSDSFNEITSHQEDTPPPPGLRRMVLGQMEHSETAPADEPPFSRIIPGQQETTPVVVPSQPPEGLHRMIPGESSSPESTLRQQPGSETRSATIGADTPPTTTTKKRRDSIEEAAIVNSVKNLTIEDRGDENNGSRRHSRQESSESEHEPRGKSPRERRYKEDVRDRNRGRYSPEEYRDKKHERKRYKERRYEDETDYYSDKDRRHRDEREYDRKYSSLRKEKDKERKRRDDRREYDRRYYGRYEDDYENESRSRASSRSEHDSYRERRDRRHKDRHRRHHRDPFNPYGSGYPYDVYSQYYQQYQYYENLRKTNPQAYAQLYRKYYQDAAVAGGEDRASVHSGRSSANDELAKERYTRQSYYSQTSLPLMGGYYRGSQTHSVSGQYGLDDSSFVRTFDQTDNSLNYEDPSLAAQRLTPAKYATAHVKASITSGKLVKILPHYPLDGQSATVELCALESLLYNDEEYKELKNFPGPLVKGVTHKKTIIEYCESKIQDAPYDHELSDPESYVLMWELLILLIRQNGMVVGTDIAELLLKNRHQEPPPRSSSVGSNSTADEDQPRPDSNNLVERTTLKEEEITDKFREHLLYGSGKEALEWAMKYGLWGHALFLASKLDKRTYANVMMRFANGLTMNDPLQTLYQLLSGRIPAAVTCVADEKWGDWRPHLAMILSNSTQRPELNCKAITTLGDTLLGRGSLFAAQFCYLMAEVGFGIYGSPEAKLVLLGSNHDKPFLHFATNEAIHMTEVYEYACSLNDDNFTLANFQRYKYIMATRLADIGILERALAYLEQVANFVVKNPTSVDSNLIDEVATLADRLKYYDPVGDHDEDAGLGADLDTSRPDNSWLKDLRKIQNDYNMGLLSQDYSATATGHENHQQIYGQQDVWQQQQPQQLQYEQYQQKQQWSAEPQIEPPQIEYQKQSDQQPETYPASTFQDQQQYWPGQQQWSSEQSNLYHQEPVDQHEQSYYGSVAQSEDIPKPQITLPNQKKIREDDVSVKEEPKRDIKPKPQINQENKHGSNNGWFGGIFSKLSLKPKNQMKLPDDKNPTIVWDSDKKRWVNTDGDNGESSNDFKPPPKMSEIPPKMPQTHNPVPHNPVQQLVNTDNVPEANGPKSLQPNMFKLQKGRNLKKSYIDVFNPNGTKTGISQAAPGPLLPTQQTVPTQMNFFIPQPVNDPNAPTDFLTPAPPLQYDDSSQAQ